MGTCLSYVNFAKISKTYITTRNLYLIFWGAKNYLTITTGVLPENTSKNNKKKIKRAKRATSISGSPMGLSVIQGAPTTAISTRKLEGIKWRICPNPYPATWPENPRSNSFLHPEEDILVKTSKRKNQKNRLFLELGPRHEREGGFGIGRIGRLHIPTGLKKREKIIFESLLLKLRD